MTDNDQYPFRTKSVCLQAVKGEIETETDFQSSNKKKIETRKILEKCIAIDKSGNKQTNQNAGILSSAEY